MISEGVVYTSTSILMLLTGIAMGYLLNFIWKFVIRQCINKKFINIFNVVALLLLGAILANTVLVFIYLGDNTQY